MTSIISCSSCAFHFWNKHVSTSSSNHKTKASLSSFLKPLVKDLPQIPSSIDDYVHKNLKQISVGLAEAITDGIFRFRDQPYLPSQSNFSPVEEIEDAVRVTGVQGSIPGDFPEGVYMRNGANPVNGALASTESIFGKSSDIWVEGEGMIHALYLSKDTNGNWTTVYNNKYVQTESFKLQKQATKKGHSFLPIVEGDPFALLSGILLNSVRFGMPDRDFGNTSIFEHSGKYYATAENKMPIEIDIRTLETIGIWDEVHRTWGRPFTSHPKKDPTTGDLITVGFNGEKPYCVLGIMSADNAPKLIHRVDLEFERSVFCHEVGVTMRYNVIPDFPIIIDASRLLSGGSLIKYEKDQFARIGVMPRFGDVSTLNWFEVESCCVFHMINCYEEGDEVIVMACRAEDSIIPGPELGIEKDEWFSRGFKHINSVNSDDEGFLFARPYEWRFNMVNRQVKGRYIVPADYALDFPVINEKFTGVKNKYSFAQVGDSIASSTAARVKYNGLAKIYHEEKSTDGIYDQGKKVKEEMNKIQYHIFPENTFCTGSVFVPKDGAVEEDDGWLVTYVHNETTNVSEVYIIDATNVSNEPIARITLPYRVPYGFHGAFMPLTPLHKK